MVLGVTYDPIDWVSSAILVVALLVSFFVATRFSRKETLVAPLRKRFVLGVPWGTIVVIVAVYGIYHLIQGGDKPGGPIIVGFRSWSLWYPQSMLFSSFTHANNSHLISNLLGTLAFAPIAEYAWSHYPTARGSTSFGSWRSNPFVRILIFVGAVLVFGLLGSLLVPGAIIGFSGAVFAFAGFALVTRPLPAVFAIVGIRVIALLRRAFLEPFTTAGATPSLTSPGWARIALQGHVFGLLVGMLIGVWLLRSRDRMPNLRHVWFATLVFAVSRSMHAIYWFQSEDQFLFFRGIGTALVLFLASLAAIATLRYDRPEVPGFGLPARTTAAGVLLAVVCALALVGIPYNLVGVSPGEEVETGVDVRDYTVTYAEGVENQYVSALEVPVVRESLVVNVSGVIVASDRRNAWEVAKTKRELALHGFDYVVVGDATWRDVVVINRTEWVFDNQNRTYKVFGRQAGESEQTLLFNAEPVQTDTIINGSKIAIRPRDDIYEIVVYRKGSVLEAAPVPGNNQSVEIADITFQRKNDALRAKYERTVVRIATYRTGGREFDL